MFNAIQNCPIPVVSQVHGFCFGGGCGIVAASDIVIAAPGTLFAFSEAKLGLIPATISPFVKAKIGAAARELFVTASPFDAETALRIGLVNVLGGSEEVEKRIKCILACGPEAVRASKQLALNEPLGSQAAASLLAETRTRAEAQEGIAAFLEKRKPNFGGTA
jgi:enoyl-CoA hydratase/carnithine racemase